jgi:integrase
MRLGRFLNEMWLPAITPTIRPTTYVGYELHVRRHIAPQLGTTSLAKLDPGAINALYATHLAAGLSPATVRRIHATLRRALRDAARWGFIEANPAERSDPPRHNPFERSMKTWTAAELRRFLATHRHHDLYALFFVLAMTGMRRGEALGLRWEDADLVSGAIAVRHTLVSVNGATVASTPKTARGRRVVAVDDATVDVLIEHRERCLLTTARVGALADLVFCRPDGAPLYPSSVSRTFTALAPQAGVPRIRLHDLRHTHATLALQAGVHPKIVSERLGHAAVSFTLDAYSHALGHLQAEAAQAVSDLVLGEGA